MDTMTALGNHGAPFTIDWNGKKYTLSYRTQKIKAKQENWVKSQTIRELVAMKEMLPTEDYNKQLKDLIDAFGQDEYAYGSELFEKKINTTAGKLAHLKTLLDDGAKDLQDSDLLQILLDKHDEIFAFIAACGANIDKIKRELGWDEKNDPKGDNIDPKAMAAKMKAAGYWE